MEADARRHNLDRRRQPVRRSDRGVRDGNGCRGLQPAAHPAPGRPLELLSVTTDRVASFVWMAPDIFGFIRPVVRGTIRPGSDWSGAFRLLVFRIIYLRR